ncbi:SDR family NAD(P)-dependent oxidoreductase [Rhizobium leguminosarum]|uniref:SDR family NAD(P)-dependent oxidoreductase n=1 Tax=Rhizobium leguminosarum TaxID=384 RepID=UPI001C92A3C5|nr:SDR family NAD(P)-dependent oxidoreductase [Rhizobium leguminosarum]MBY2924371.1 SDR family NAD(P)-dependent oxidoreductase [Rhizobium leguminosarum]
MPITTERGMAVVTGASTGIGFEFARWAAQDGYDLIIAADEAAIHEAAASLKGLGVSVEAVEVALLNREGVDLLVQSIEASGSSVDLLMINAGISVEEGFLDQEFPEARKIVDNIIVGTVYLVQQVGKMMRSRGQGRILLTGVMPGSSQALYSGTNAFISSFASDLREELKDNGITVTCLMPFPPEVESFQRADPPSKSVGQTEMDYAAGVARFGYGAMMNGEGDIVAR